MQTISSTNSNENSLKVFEAVREAHRVLIRHMKPDGPTCEETVDELLGILDNHLLVRALNLAHPQGREP